MKWSSLLRLMRGSIMGQGGVELRTFYGLEKARHLRNLSIDSWITTLVLFYRLSWLLTGQRSGRKSAVLNSPVLSGCIWM